MTCFQASENFRSKFRVFKSALSHFVTLLVRTDYTISENLVNLIQGPTNIFSERVDLVTTLGFAHLSIIDKNIQNISTRAFALAGRKE